MKRSKEKRLISSAGPRRERTDLCVSKKKIYGYLPEDAINSVSNDAVHEKNGIWIPKQTFLQ